MPKSKEQKRKEHNPNRLLFGGLEGLARSNKPDLAGIPKRFAEYDPLDLYQSFVPVKMDYKGQLCSGYVKRGWALKVGLTGEFDFSFLLAEFGVGQLQPRANIGYTKTKFSLAIVQRFPKELVYRKTAGGSNQGSGVGQTPEPEHVTKWQIEKPFSFAALLGRQTEKSVEIGIDFQWGKTLFTVAGPGIKEDGTNDAGIGVGASVHLSAKWEQLKVIDPNPGWYLTSLDDNLRNDFTNYLGPKDARDLKHEIFQWLRHCTELDIPWLPNERIKGDAKQAIEKLARMPRGIDPTDGINTLNSVLTWLPPLNMFKGPLDKLKDFSTKPKRQKLIKELEKLEKKLTNLRENKDEKGKLLEPRLRIVFLRRTKDTIDLQIQRVRAYINDLERYDEPVVPPPVGVEGGLPVQPSKLGAMSPASSFFKQADQGLCYVHIDTSDYEAAAQVVARIVVPVFAQIVTVGTADLTVGVDAGYRKSVSRFQSFCYDDNMTPMVATQDTTLTYSRVGLEAKATAQVANFFYDKTVDSAGVGIKARLTILNSIDYQSVVVYWPKLRAGGPIKVCRGSGVRFGCSVLFSRIHRLLKAPDAVDSKKLIKGMMQALRVDWNTLRNFFLSMDIDKTLPKTLVPPSLLIESAFPFPDGMALYADGTGELRDLLSAPEVLQFSKTLGKSDGPKTETLRLRMRQADWALSETASGTDFKLGFWVVDSIPNLISLKKINEAGREVIIDLYTQFITDKEYNRNPLAGQEKVVPPVALLHQ